MGKKTVTEEEKYAVYWCYNRAMDYVEKHSPLVNPYPDTDLIVNGMNISETIKNLLGKLVV
jgi:hypothetical protein